MRYIDADKLIKTLFPIGLIDDRKYTINAKAVKYAIDNTPTADVVPRAEMEKWRQRAGVRARDLDDLQKERDRLASEIFVEIKKFDRRPIPESKAVYVITESEFAELKKKYAEDNNE